VVRIAGVIVLIGAMLLVGCAAGAPGSTIRPATATPAALVALATIAPTQATTSPPTTDPPTVTPTATTVPIEATTGLAGTGGLIAADRPVGAQVASRPAPPPPPADGLSAVVEGGTNDRLEVALTFDAGADRGHAEAILDLLAGYGIRASFGMTGQWAEANPDLVQRMVVEGHMLFNHTWDHRSLTGANTGQPPMTADEVAWQVGETERVVRELTGYELKPYFRPPYGDYDATSLGYLYDNGYYISIFWTCDTRGWAGWSAQQIVDYCTVNLKSDEIILLHVGAAAAGDYESLPALIDSFAAQGYTFVTVEEMLQP
jgi:peptidoglycan/xylan/chitin deacetylase (PgdA/CDA1 family)